MEPTPTSGDPIMEPSINSSDDGSGSTSGPTPVTDPPRIGGTLNGLPRRLLGNLGLIERSNTTWLHAFVDPLKKQSAGVAPGEDPDLRALRRAKRQQGVKLIVNLRWNFVGSAAEPERIPAAGSNREAALFEYAMRQLEAIGEPVELLVLGNEPIWETHDDDLIGRNAPLLGFTSRLKSHLVQHYVGDRTRLLVGAFNKLYRSDVWADHRGLYRSLFRMAHADDDIDGIDLHIHYAERRQVQEMLEMARLRFPDGLVTVTEFSPIWRYFRYTDEPIADFDGGARFLDRHGLPEGLRVVEYFRRAKESPRPRDEMADFMSTMHWYNENLVRDMHELLAAYDVDVGVIGFLVGEGVRNVTWGDDWYPFEINWLYLGPLIEGEDGAHPHYFEDYRELA